MMATRLTREQHEAVFRPGNVAVTAGAGTGKTSAMIARVIRILGELDHIHQLLVVTFTDEAASEIRERVYRALLAQIAAAKGEERARLARLRDQFTENHISTMHTFFAYLLRRFPDAIEGLDPDFRIIEGAEQEEVLRSSIEAVLDRNAASPDAALREDLRSWLRQLGRRANVRAAVETLIRRRIELREWLRRFSEGDPRALFDSERARALEIIAEVQAAFFGSPMMKELIEQIKALRPRWADPTGKLVQTRASVLDAFRARDLDALAGQMLTSKGDARKFGNLGRKGNWDADDLSALRERLGRLAEIVAVSGVVGLRWDDALESEVIGALQALARLTSSCLDEYAQRKRRLHAVDFVDLEVGAGRLLDDPGVLRILQRQFRVIFMDEFQDTNRYQWSLFRKLACHEGTETLEPGRLFIVGDEKQAIYEFRGGEVEVCQMARQEIEAAIEFTANFRSRPNLIQFFNRFFESLLTGDAPYEATAQALRYRDDSAPPSDASEGGGSVRHLCVLTDPSRRRTTDDDRVMGREREAYAIAELLSSIIAGEREDEYPGIAARIEAGEPTVGILFRRTTHQQTYEDALRAFGVSYVAARGKGFYQRDEIRDLRNALRCLYDLGSDIALAGVLRSPLIGCSDAGLLLLAQHRHGEATLRAALRRLAREKRLVEVGFSPPDADAIRKADALLDRWERLARTHGISSLLAQMLADSGAYAPLSLGSDGRQRVLNVEKLVDIAREYEAHGAPTLGDFIRFLDTQTTGADDEGDADLPEGGSVQLLTVHRAKGLEWPLVIVPDTNGKFRHRIEETTYSDGRSHRAGVAVGAVSHRTGEMTSEVAMKYRKPDHTDAQPFAWKLLERERKRRMLAEQKRLLYVAFTRAQEHLVFCTTVDLGKEPRDMENARSWADWIHHVIDGFFVAGEMPPFFHRDQFTATERVAPRVTLPTRAPISFEKARLWRTPQRRPGVYRITDEPIGERGQIPPCPELETLARRDRAREQLGTMGNRLLPYAYARREPADALLKRARTLAQGTRAILPEAAVPDLIRAVIHVREWLDEAFSEPREVLWNEAFEYESGGRRLVGQVDVLVLDLAGQWAAVDVKYARRAQALSGRAEAYFDQLKMLERAVEAILGTDAVRTIACFASPDGVQIWEPPLAPC